MEIKDGEKLPLAVKDMGSCEVFPHAVVHSPNGRLVVCIYKKKYASCGEVYMLCDTLRGQIKGIFGLYISHITLWSGHDLYNALWLGHYFYNCPLIYIRLVCFIKAQIMGIK